HLVDALDGGLEVDDRVDVARGDAGGRRSRIAPTRQGVQTRPERSEARRDVWFGESRELAESAEAEARKQRRELGIAEGCDGQRGEESRGLARGHDAHIRAGTVSAHLPGACGELGREKP